MVNVLKILSLITCFLLSDFAFSHEIFLSTQLVKIRRQNETGKQVDLVGSTPLNRQLSIGLQATYLERFSFYEKRAGGFVQWKPIDGLVLEGRYLKGGDNQILTQDLLSLSANYALADGLSPFIVLRESRYSITTLRTTQLGIEIEKIPSIIIIPQLTFGKASFRQVDNTRDVYNYGVKGIYYREGQWAASAFVYHGKEAAQGIIGRSSRVVTTFTGGLGGSYQVTQDVRAELIVDHTDYQELKNSFLTTTFNLNWMF